MPDVVLLEEQEQAALEGRMVRGIVNLIVCHVPNEEPGKERWHIVETKNEPEDDIEYRRQGDAHRRNHHQPLGVIRIVVVNAMSKKVDSFSPLALRLIVKREAVKKILCQRPHESS